MWTLLFWVSLLSIAYSYLLYPELLRIWSKGKHLKPPQSAAELPEVTVIFAAYNEEAVIDKKLQSIVDSDYPAEKLFVHVGSDASTDSTDEILQKWAEKNPRITWKRLAGRTGKAQIINQLAEESATEILVPTDANIVFHAQTISNLVRWFSNDEIDIVGSNIVYMSPPDKGIAKQEDYYLNRENRIKTYESILYGTAMGIEGGCYAIRRSAFRSIPKNYFMEDFFQSMQVLQRNKKVLVDENSVVYEDVSTDIREEYKRKTRISIGNFQNLKHFSGVLIKQTFPLGFVFFSHKVLRWITPFFLIIMFFSALQLAFSGSMFFQWLTTIAMTWMLLTLMHAKSMIKLSRKLAFAAHFLYMNIALFHGFIIFNKGIQSNVWQPTKRNQD